MTDTVVPPEYAALLDIPVATTVTIGASGYPQASAVWFLYEDGKIRTSLVNTNQKVANAIANPKGTVLLVDPTNPYKTLELRGDFSVEDDADVSFLRRQLVKYGTTPEDFGRGTDGRVVLSLTPSRVRVWG